MFSEIHLPSHKLTSDVTTTLDEAYAGGRLGLDGLYGNVVFNAGTVYVSILNRLIIKKPFYLKEEDD